MYPFLKHPEFFNQPIHVNPENLNFQEELRKFFVDYHLIDIRIILWRWYEVAITSENDNYADAEERATLLCAYLQIERIIEVLFLIHEDYKLSK